MEDQTLTFGHEGVLFRGSFTMYDHETGSLWIQALGEAIKGKLKGARLTLIPSQVTSWERWRQLQPETTVLLATRTYNEHGIFRAPEELADHGLSIGRSPAIKLYPFSELAKSPVLRDTVNGLPLVLVFDPQTTASLVYEARLEGAVLDLGDAGKDDRGRRLLVDRANGSRWLALTGVCIEGSLQGRRLRRVPATPWSLERWRRFFPKGEIYAR